VRKGEQANYFACVGARKPEANVPRRGSGIFQ